MKELFNRATEINKKYAQQLEALGIKTVISRRYSEIAVEERYSSYTSIGSAIFNPIERARDREREVKNGYDYQPNRFHCIVLYVMPSDRKLLKKDDCREYAFIVEKVTRPHIGIEPHKVTHKENKILAKIEKRILKIIKQASGKPAEWVCKNTFRDAVRYSFSPKYEHKTEYCGKERFTWDMIFLAVASVIAFSFVFVLWAVSKSF